MALGSADISAVTDLIGAFREVRGFTESICEPLATEDYCIQSMPDVSPTKWHLAHTTWFFERFILREHVADYQPHHPQYNYLFNSYYNTIGPQHCRVRRGTLSRPTVQEVYDYRQTIDARLVALLESADDASLAGLETLVTLGLHHEQQHQELMLTDLKHVFSSNPLLPTYRADDPGRSRFGETGDGTEGEGGPARWVEIGEGVYEIGRAIDSPGFAFDNETPRHRVFLEPFALASRPTTNGEFLRFIEAGGYDTPELWLSAGWATVQEQGWTHPFYWYRDPDRADAWMQFTLQGPQPLAPDEPVCHLSYFEADAFARWAGHRLPTEAEWEVAAADQPIEGNLADDRVFHPLPCSENPVSDANHQTLRQLFGDVWEWTASQYTPYPGFSPLPGALGEYNGKFMCNQFVLRGGSCFTPKGHLRPTYRNFFAPDARWQCSGLRLAKNL